MKLIFFINSLHTAGGTERVSSVIANQLVNLGYDVSIVALHGGGKPFFNLHPLIKVHYIHPHGYRSVYWLYISNILKLRRLLSAQQPDYIIDVCSAMSLMSIPATRWGKTQVITWEHFNSNVDWNRITTPLSRRMASKYAQYIVTLTEEDATNYRKRYHAKNVVAIPNPITIESKNPSPINEKCVLAMGRLTPQKGFDLLLPAWASICRNHQTWRLRIIGEGDMIDKLNLMIADLHLGASVEIVPPSSDVILEYQKASIFVLSSRFEGLPLVLIEAMAMGLPIVSFDCDTGPREIVVHRKTGILVEPLNIELLAAALNELMGDSMLRETFARNAILQSGNFAPTKVISMWCNLLGTNKL